MSSSHVLNAHQAIESIETAQHTRSHRSERSTPFRQPGATQGAPTAIESAQNARTHSGRPLPLRTDGRTHQQRSIRPTIGTLWPSTDSPELWNPRDLRGTVLGTRGVRKEKGQRQHRL